MTLQTAAAVAARAADAVSDAAAARPDLVLGLPTGRTAIPFYAELARRHRTGALDLARARAFALDELVLPPGHAGSFGAFLDRYAGPRIGLLPERSRRPDVTLPAGEACRRYDAALAEAGGLDLAVLGLGADGHVAYNLPGEAHEDTHVVDVPDAVAASLAVPVHERPLRAITIGLGVLRSARRLVLMATTVEKARALAALRRGLVDADWPCTRLVDHPAFEVLVTPEAGGLPR